MGSTDRIVTCPDEAAAAAMLERLRALANQASLHPGAFVPVGEVRQEGCRVVCTFAADGVLLADYVEEWFGEYMADEDFALELLYHLTECARAAGRPLALHASEVMLMPDGAVRMLDPAMKDVSEREALRSAGHLLFWLLTRSEPTTYEMLLACHEVNREISSSAAALVRRCVQGVEGGGFGSVASLRQALLEVLRGRGRAPSGVSLRDFRRHRPRVEYEASMRASLEAEEAHLSALHAAPATAPLERALRRFFGDPEKQGLRPLWIPFIVGYLALVAPFLMLRIPVADMAVWAVALLFGYVGVFAGIYTSYRRHRD